MEVNFNPNTRNQHLKAHNTRDNAISFKNGVIVSTVDMINRGGLFANFTVQDVLGLNFPRTAGGLLRNKEYTGEYNFQECAEVAAREFLTGPSLFAIPMLMLWGIKRFFGKANDVPVDFIKAFGQMFNEFSMQNQNSIAKSSPENIKNTFRKYVFENILNNTNYKDSQVESDKFVKILEDIEKAPKKRFIDRLLGHSKPETNVDILEKLKNRFIEIRKGTEISTVKDFLNAEIKASDGISHTTNIEKIIAHMNNFTDDIVNKLKDNQHSVGETVEKFIHSRVFSRNLTNISMLGGVLTFCSIIPKIYHLNDKNPGVQGLDAQKLAGKIGGGNANK